VTTRTDVIVVGSGPAGSTAARCLAASGRDVILLDRAQFPRPKVCGDGLTPRAIGGLQRLGVWQFLAGHATIVTELHTKDLVTGTTVAGELPSRVTSGPAFGAVLPRVLLDDVLRQAAVAAGARFESGTQVRGIEAATRHRPIRVHAGLNGRTRTWEANVVIAADGANSRIAETTFGTKPGVVRGVAVRQYWRVRVPRSFTICIPLGGGMQELAGYGWVFPIGEEMANVGVGIIGDTACSIRSTYRQFVDRLRRDCENWASAAPVGSLEGGALAAGMRRGQVARDGLLFVGDAAGAVNPFSGEGIAQAIDGGVAAADAVTSTSDRGTRLAAAYWNRLVDAFPQSTRNVESLPWLVDRGATFTREFWHATSSAERTMSRAARRMSLDEDPGARRAFSSPDAEAAWAALGARLERRRPLFTQLLDAIRHEAAPLIEATIACVRADAELGDPSLADVDVALAMITLVMLVANDPSSRPPRSGSADVADVVSWATDSAALATADLLVAELFGALTHLPRRWSVPLTAAVGEMLADETRHAMAGVPHRSVLDVLIGLAKAVTARATRSSRRQRSLE